jgi:predicted metal-dependent hydrolase
MSVPLEELKQQRAQIQAHLAWIDAKIAAYDSQPQTDPPEISALAASKQLHAKPKPTEDSTHTQAHENVAIEDHTSQANTTDLEFPSELPEIEKSTYKARTQSELKRAKIGCVLFFILSCLLFLFLLFVLPYLV